MSLIAEKKNKISKEKKVAIRKEVKRPGMKNNDRYIGLSYRTCRESTVENVDFVVSVQPMDIFNID